MAFTVNQLLHNSNFPHNENHRMRLGRRFVSSYRAKFGEPDTFQEIAGVGEIREVKLYPDSFRDHAIRLIHRYYRDYWKGKRTWQQEKKKRKRIVKYQKIQK